MKKTILYGSLATLSVAALPVCAVACTHLSKKQKEVWDKYQKLDKKYGEELHTKYNVKKLTKEDVAKLSDDQCDALLAIMKLIPE